jgi:peptidoglycan/LPS O-acetylase OafA/YrhL
LNSRSPKNGLKARPFVIFGRVPFFFYVVHFYVLGLAAALVRTKFGLPETCLIWLALLIVMAAFNTLFRSLNRVRESGVPGYPRQSARRPMIARACTDV